mmetsp:Transcript_22041/g.50930  ORF Transcript_22041/g.50930 Transcript_22041/m.50930 type:complete len:256 (-) Transcript_22041:72-839(-)
MFGFPFSRSSRWLPRWKPGSGKPGLLSLSTGRCAGVRGPVEGQRNIGAVYGIAGPEQGLSGYRFIGVGGAQDRAGSMGAMGAMFVGGIQDWWGRSTPSLKSLRGVGGIHDCGCKGPVGWPEAPPSLAACWTSCALGWSAWKPYGLATTGPCAGGAGGCGGKRTESAGGLGLGSRACRGVSQRGAAGEEAGILGVSAGCIRRAAPAMERQGVGRARMTTAFPSGPGSASWDTCRLVGMATRGGHVAEAGRPPPVPL